MFKSLEFDGVDSRNYGVYITGESSFNAPERAVEMVSIPGRNGALIMDQGRYENITVSYPASMCADNEADFAQNLADFRNAIVSRRGYCRLTDEYNPNEYRLALYREGLEVDKKHLTAGEFDIVFDCKPQRFLTSGETKQTFTADGTIDNPTLFEAQPIITVTGNGTLTINGVAMVIGGSSNTVIDCELMECYDGAVSKNSDVIMTPNVFPTLSPGSNTIDLTAGLTKVEIVPRWWQL